MSLIRIENLVKEYRTMTVVKRALAGFSMEMEEGDFTAIMGPSGAGKTTLLNIMATIDKPSSGTITFRDTDLASVKRKQLADFRRDNLGFVFQDHNLLETLTIRENILLPLLLQKRLSHDGRTQRVEELSRFLGITDILEKFPQENSGGQRQRAAIARALAGDPGLILADEPTGALDSENAHKLMKSLSRANAEQNASVMLVTHDPMVASYTKRVVFIKDGQFFSEVRGNGSREDLYASILRVLSVLEGASNDN